MIPDTLPRNLAAASEKENKVPDTTQPNRIGTQLKTNGKDRGLARVGGTEWLRPTWRSSAVQAAAGTSGQQGRGC